MCNRIAPDACPECPEKESRCRSSRRLSAHTARTALRLSVLGPITLSPPASSIAVSLAAFFRTPLLPDIGRDLGLSAGQLSLITAAFAIGRLALDLPGGRVADRFSASAVCAGAAVALVCGSVALAAAQSLVHALAPAALPAVASAVTNTTGMTAFSTHAPTGSAAGRSRCSRWLL